MNKVVFFALFLIGFHSYSFAQTVKIHPDTLRLTIADAENRFIKENLTLLADRYDIDIAKSKVLDARLWNNPNFNYAQGLYDPHTKNFFDYSSTGTSSIQLQELFSIAGKHTNTVKLARISEKLTELQFQDITRSLKYELYTDFNTLLSDQQQAVLYNYEIEKLSLLLSSMNQEKQLGVLAGNDIIRLKAEIENLKNASVQNYNDLMATEKDLKVLLNAFYSTYIVVEDAANPSKTLLPALPDLINTAEANRPDMQVSKTTVEYQMQNIKLQRSLSVPDFTMAVWHDASGSYATNIDEISLGFDIPIFNRNQHQVRIAKYQIEQQKLKDSLQQNTLQNEVAQAFDIFQNVNSQYGSLDVDYNRQLDELNNGAINNYSKRLINLVDFLDQIRTFTSSRLSFIQLKKQYFDSVNYLNFVVGTPVIK